MRNLLIQICLLFLFLEITPDRTFAKQKPTDRNTYRVQAGDSWWGIAKKLRTTPKELAAINGRTEKEALYQNELLRIGNTTVSKSEVKKIAPKSKPNSPLPGFEKIAKPYSELTYDPHRGVRYSRENSGWVRAALPGKVVHIDYMDGYENYIILEHENGWYSVYGNLERVQVTEGQTLVAKERLGTLIKDKGLYFQVNHNKSAINPVLFLQQGS
ncbi:LIC_10271 family cell wall hydrolase [Leptospira ilyithenensis]|uniref:LysM peptidoglycan-binding domain-containing protein n=1 Tax=Leptospira ilyithenensis TaxID=2484901 RepID=A0A4V3JX82_9LEPT|nr:M23 family metallopeptidase [Leptospira ilyithenensis]TGN11634.1 LysM peptidoglycan-binding domain-containing protein [Leptospira ilyithenensis]